MTALICPKCKDPNAKIVFYGQMIALCMVCKHEFNEDEERAKQNQTQSQLESQIAAILCESANQTAKAIAELAFAFHKVAEKDSET